MGQVTAQYFSLSNAVMTIAEVMARTVRDIFSLFYHCIPRSL